MAKNNKNDPTVTGSQPVNSFHNQFNTFDKDLKLMITLSALNGTTTSLMSTYVFASVVAAVRELETIHDPILKSAQEMIILTTLEMSKSKLTKPS